MSLFVYFLNFDKVESLIQKSERNFICLSIKIDNKLSKISIFCLDMSLIDPLIDPLFQYFKAISKTKSLP